MDPRAVLRICAFCMMCFGIVLTRSWAESSDPLVQVREDFSRDPGWEGVNNRIVGVDGPTVNQNFGWTAGEDGKGPYNQGFMPQAAPVRR